MTCTHFRSGGVVCTFSDPAIYLINDGARSRYFDWSDRFGPSRTDRRGEILDNQPGERSPFWRSVSLWARQGKKWEPFGYKDRLRRAIWTEPPAGRRVIDPRGLIIEWDEPDGFDDVYSHVFYVDEQGQPVRPRRKARRL